MKIAFLVLMSIAFSANSALAAAAFKSVPDAIKKLSSFSPADLVGERERLKANQPMKIDEMYAALSSANELAKTSPVSEEFAFQMERVALITIINNPMAYGAELILPAYVRNRKVFAAAAESLDVDDEKLILAVLSGHAESTASGTDPK